MKKIMVLLCLLCAIECVGCGTKNNDRKMDKVEKSSEEIMIEQQCIEEENLALENCPKFDISVNRMSDILNDESNLLLEKDDNLCCYKGKEDYDVQIGKWDSNISEIYFMVYKYNDLNDEGLRDDFLNTVKIILTTVSEEYDEKRILNEISKVTEPGQTIEVQYSDDIKLFICKMDDDLDFRIYPQ